MKSLSFCSWKESYNTGIEEIDIQHRKIADYISELYGSISQNVAAETSNLIVEELVQYTKTHFVYEEKLMEQNKFTKIDEHKKVHEEFKNKLNVFIDKAQKKQQITFQLVQFLRDWLIEHIQVEDKEYVPFVLKK
jgi:hemerythrin